MCYAITDSKSFIGKDFFGRATLVSTKERACTFKTELSANNFLKCIPDTIKRRDWKIQNLDEGNDELMITDVKKFGNSTKPTVLEDENFDICNFFENAIMVMSQLDRFIVNMSNNEQLVDMKILDIRHYIRNNNHKLSAIQMQRLGYYLQDLEKERYEYKSKRLIASMFANSIDSLKDKSNIDKMNDVLTSKYNPRVLDDTDIEYIINKKKDIAFIA